MIFNYNLAKMFIMIKQ